MAKAEVRIPVYSALGIRTFFRGADGLGCYQETTKVIPLSERAKAVRLGWQIKEARPDSLLIGKVYAVPEYANLDAIVAAFGELDTFALTLSAIGLKNHTGQAKEYNEDGKIQVPAECQKVLAMLRQEGFDVGSIPAEATTDYQALRGILAGVLAG